MPPSKTLVPFPLSLDLLFLYSRHFPALGQVTTIFYLDFSNSHLTGFQAPTFHLTTIHSLFKKCKSDLIMSRQDLQGLTYLIWTCPPPQFLLLPHLSTHSTYTGPSNLLSGLSHHMTFASDSPLPGIFCLLQIFAEPTLHLCVCSHVISESSFDHAF